MMGSARRQAVRLNAAVAFPLQRGVDHGIALGLRDLARLALHLRDNLAVRRVLNDHAGVLHVALAGYGIDGVLVALVAETVSVAAGIACKAEMGSRESVIGRLVNGGIGKFRGARMAIGVVEALLAAAGITGSADRSDLLALVQRAGEH